MADRPDRLEPDRPDSDRPDPASPDIDRTEPEAPPAPADLLAAARDAFANAYAPYSGFRVGVALRGDDGAVYRGANVENASYGLSRCGEQSAVQALASAGARGFSEGVIYTAAARPATPCGACRQILMEFSPDATLYLVNESGDEVRYAVRELLPNAFTL